MDAMGVEPYERVWRPPLGTRVVGWVITGVAALLAASALATALGGDVAAGAAALVVVVNAVVAVAAWRWSGYPFVAASDDGLTIRNPLRTLVVPWHDIVGARASSLGLTVAVASGEQVVAWAVTRSTLATWLGRTSRSDEVIAYVARRVFGEVDGVVDSEVEGEADGGRSAERGGGLPGGDAEDEGDEVPPAP